MKELFNGYGFALSKAQEEKFLRFSEILRDYNQKVNLTSITDEEEIKVKHFLDSVLGAPYFPKNARVIEIGSGGGFPSLPLKIVREDLTFLQVESVGKKCAFLEYAEKELELSGMTVVSERAEVLGKDPSHREKYDVVTARAVANLSTLSEYCLPLVKKGGVFIAYKGTPEAADCEVKDAKNALSVLGGRWRESAEFTLPSGERRTVVVIDKVKNTPEKYPRGNGKERNHPL